MKRDHEPSNLFFFFLITCQYGAWKIQNSSSNLLKDLDPKNNRASSFSERIICKSRITDLLTGSSMQQH